MASSKLLRGAAKPVETNDKYEEVLDAAARCFMARGYESTTIDHIAAALGASKGRVYYHFETKADIFFSVYDRAMDKCLTAAGPWLTAEGSPKERLQGLMTAHLLMLMVELPYHTVANMGVEVYLHEGALTPRQRETMKGLIARRDAYEEQFRAQVQAGVDAGELAVADTVIASRTLLASLNAVSVWYRPRSGQTRAARQAIADAVVHTLLHGIVGPA